jgi:hypothetical protein
MMDEGFAVSNGLQAAWQLASPPHAGSEVTMTVALLELPSGSVPVIVSVPPLVGLYIPVAPMTPPALPELVHVALVCVTPSSLRTHWLVSPTEIEGGAQVTTGVAGGVPLIVSVTDIVGTGKSGVAPSYPLTVTVPLYVPFGSPLTTDGSNEIVSAPVAPLEAPFAMVPPEDDMTSQLPPLVVEVLAVQFSVEPGAPVFVIFTVWFGMVDGLREAEVVLNCISAVGVQRIVNVALGLEGVNV